MADTPGHTIPPIQRLRAALKLLGRGYHLRCIGLIQERKAEGDKADCEKIIVALKYESATERRLRTRTGFGRSKQQRLLDLLTSQGKIKCRTVEIRGKECEEYFAI